MDLSTRRRRRSVFFSDVFLYVWRIICVSNLGIGRFLACSYDFIRIQTHFKDFNGKHEHEIVTIKLLRFRILKNPNVYCKVSKKAGS